jgi:hypothetical protein
LWHQVKYEQLAKFVYLGKLLLTLFRQQVRAKQPEKLIFLDRMLQLSSALAGESSHSSRSR